MGELLEIRWHGRGGQGIVTTSQLLVAATFYDGKYAIAIPQFGPERRGAPVVAYNRISDKPVRARSSVESPDIVVVVDPSLATVIDVTRGLKSGGLLLFNGTPPENLAKKELRIAYARATDIALKHGLVLAGLPLAGVPMLGALARATGIVSLGSLIRAVRERWSGSIAEKNAAAIEEGYEEVAFAR